MTGTAYWRYYCQAAGLSEELSARVVAECHKRGTFNDIDYRIKAAKELSKAAFPIGNMT